MGYPPDLEATFNDKNSSDCSGPHGSGQHVPGLYWVARRVALVGLIGRPHSLDVSIGRYV